MIIARLSGGLGNQMFQYALGKALSLKRRTELKLDTSSFGKIIPGESIRSFALNGFAISAPIATQEDFKKIGVPYSQKMSFMSRVHKYLFEIADKMQIPTKKRIIREKSFTFDSSILTSSDNSYLVGVWQSEKYFTEIKDVIRNEFLVKKWSELGSTFKKQIETKSVGTPISVHVRRSDYVSNAKAHAKHGVLPIEYYKQAFDLIIKKVSNPTFYIFSDDIEWCRENLSFMRPTIVVSDPELSPTEEMILMSLCEHHVIANSSFSWWGAWLNPKKDKTVISPQEWFKTIADTSDLIPEGWARI